MTIELLNYILEEIKARKAREDYYRQVSKALAKADLTGIDRMAREFTAGNDLL